MFNDKFNDQFYPVFIIWRLIRLYRKMQCEKSAWERGGVLQSESYCERLGVSECEWQMKMGKIRSTSSVSFSLCLVIWCVRFAHTVSCVLETSNPSSEKEEKEKADDIYTMQNPRTHWVRESIARVSRGCCGCRRQLYLVAERGVRERQPTKPQQHHQQQQQHPFVCNVCLFVFWGGVVIVHTWFYCNWLSLTVPPRLAWSMHRLRPSSFQFSLTVYRWIFVLL